MVVYRFWVDFGSKNLSKIGGLRVVISTSLRICEKYDFERPSIVFATFFKVESIDFRSQNVYFSNVFLNFFLILDRILVQMGGQMDTKIDTKTTLERMPKQAWKK